MHTLAEGEYLWPGVFQAPRTPWERSTQSLPFAALCPQVVHFTPPASEALVDSEFGIGEANFLPSPGLSSLCCENLGVLIMTISNIYILSR